MVKGEKAAGLDSQTGYQKYVGIDKFKVVKINPTKEELSELLDTEIETEPVYIGRQDKEGNPMSSVSVWVEGEKSGRIFNIRFMLIDKDRVSKAGNPQWINSVGDTTYASSKDTVPVWFANLVDNKTNQVIEPRTVRPAKVGEEELYAFLKAALRVKKSKAGAEISYEFKKLMAGNLRELIADINSEYGREFIGVAIVRSVEKDGEVKQYQGVSTKGFLPGDYFRYVNNGGSVDAFHKNVWDKFKKGIEGEYGEKAFYSLDVIHEYDESEDMSAGDDTKGETSDDGTDF